METPSPLVEHTPTLAELLEKARILESVRLSLGASLDWKTIIASWPRDSELSKKALTREKVGLWQQLDNVGSRMTIPAPAMVQVALDDIRVSQKGDCLIFDPVNPRSIPSTKDF